MEGARLPNFLIVGAAKAGTTSLSTWLADHPQAFIPEAKELYFFEHAERWARGVAWYREQFAAGREAVAVGEATPNYMFLPDGARRMAAVVPDARLIALLREPGARAHSHYWYWRARKGSQRKSFEEAVREELALPRRAFEDPDHRLDQPGVEPKEAARRRRPQFLARGRYLPQLERLCEYFPRESLLVLLLDDLQSRPVETFKRVCGFLGIEKLVGESVGHTYNEAYTFRPAALAKAMGTLRIGKVLPPRLGLLLFHRMRTVRPNPPMDAGIRRVLDEHFAPDNEELGKWLGRDLRMWADHPDRMSTGGAQQEYPAM